MTHWFNFFSPSRSITNDQGFKYYMKYKSPTTGCYMNFPDIKRISKNLIVIIDHFSQFDFNGIVFATMGGQ